jgi:phenylalanyl-tRNA synthetase alpha chain
MRIEELKTSAMAAIRNAADARSLEDIRVHYLGRRGEVTSVLRSLGDLPLEERRRVGPEAQSAKREIEEAIAKKLKAFAEAAPASHRTDLTAPGKKFSRGHLHLLTIVQSEIRRIFTSMNFSVVEGHEAETEYYNFDALNIPADHPARDMWDTFWLRSNQKVATSSQLPAGSRKLAAGSGKLLLRTHTSPMQVRYMETHEPPFQIIVPGRVFRYEATDASHEANFYQLEGLMVGKRISLANFKFVIEEFFKQFFPGKKIEFRYRPSYFPFTEPSVEVDVKFKGKWLEMMGAGMVHPRVFEYAHYNPRDWQGFAFGVGIDRLAMIKYGVPDIRLFYSGDLRFVNQF